MASGGRRSALPRGSPDSASMRSLSRVYNLVMAHIRGQEAVFRNEPLRDPLSDPTRKGPRTSKTVPEKSRKATPMALGPTDGGRIQPSTPVIPSQAQDDGSARGAI
ncbi:hypothetical protein FAGKG844_130006 [Frankia sp. AgKG'84/4]